MMFLYWFIVCISLLGFLAIIFYIYLLYHCRANKTKLFQLEEWKPKLTIGKLIECVIFSIVPVGNYFIAIIFYAELFASVQSGFWDISVCKWLFKTPKWYAKVKEFFNIPIRKL